MVTIKYIDEVEYVEIAQLLLDFDLRDELGFVDVNYRCVFVIVDLLLGEFLLLALGLHELVLAHF